METGWAQDGCCTEPSTQAPLGLTERPEPHPRGLQFPDLRPLVGATFSGGNVLRPGSLVVVAEITMHLQELRLGGRGPALSSHGHPIGGQALSGRTARQLAPAPLPTAPTTTGHHQDGGRGGHMRWADPARRCSCLGCQASSIQEALQDARAMPAAGSPALIHLFHCLWSPSLQPPLRFGGHTVHRRRCSRVRGGVGAAGTLTPASLREAQSQVLDPHWVRAQGTLPGHRHLGLQGWDPQGR